MNRRKTTVTTGDLAGNYERRGKRPSRNDAPTVDQLGYLPLDERANFLAYRKPRAALLREFREQIGVNPSESDRISKRELGKALAVIYQHRGKK